MTPDERYARCETVVLKLEDGYDDNPKDVGGPTCMGVTLTALETHRGHACTAADVRALTQPEAAAIYRSQYWAAVRGDDLPAGVDLITFDAAVNCGRREAVLFLQRALGVTADGALGPITMGALTAAEPVGLIARICTEREAYYRSLPAYVTFGRGWLNRVANVARTATKWATPTKPSLISRVLAVITPPPTPTLAPIFTPPDTIAPQLPPPITAWPLIAPNTVVQAAAPSPVGPFVISYPAGRAGPLIMPAIPALPIAPDRAEAPPAAHAGLEPIMSWFTQRIEHPAMAALAMLANNPAIAQNPAAAQAVTAAQATATTVASTAVAAASTVAAEVAVSVDPIVADFEKGLQATTDAALISTIGPVGEALAPMANTLLTLLEARAHSYLTALFAHAKTQLPAPAAAS